MSISAPARSAITIAAMPTSGTPVTSVQAIVSRAATVGPRARAGARPASARATSGRVSRSTSRYRIAQHVAPPRPATTAGGDGKRGGLGRVDGREDDHGHHPDLHRMLRDLGGVAQGQVLLGRRSGPLSLEPLHQWFRHLPSPAAPDWERDRYEDDEHGHVEDRETNGVIRIGRAGREHSEDQDEQPAQPVCDDRIPQQAAPRQARQRCARHAQRPRPRANSIGRSAAVTVRPA